MSSLSIGVYNLCGRVPGKKREESHEVDCYRESRESIGEKFRTQIMLDKNQREIFNK